ncbi:hypothetical protein CRH09_27365 [Nocardia terpenica]|uniref:Methyltransferase domain-containing protein n=2 Tax=Nocardia terpenica TaxID=455432 RepID=A0A291RPR9_9NOCA|nr:hypothetical protein CRH09_27365 [Nocardia terpenica]
MAEPMAMQDDSSTGTLYSAAATHYLSPARRDAVKRNWEERFSQSIFARAANEVGAMSPIELRVIDIGSGTGDALRLLDGALEVCPIPPVVEYLGLDVDPSMLDIARAAHRGRAGVGFLLADVRDGVPARPAELYLSSGVPYSHLSRSELESVLADVFRTIVKNRTRSVVVVDVLGRYSIEWAPHWAFDQWTYEMTFFHGDDRPPRADMSFYSGKELAAVVAAAGQRSAVKPDKIEFFDRSISVGRHTATGTFSSEVRPYRSLVNRLFQGDTTFDLDDLLFVVPRYDAPVDVGRFFTSFASSWNASVRRCADTERNTGESAELRICLAEDLRSLEFRSQRGLGVGHSLICLISVDGRDG